MSSIVGRAGRALCASAPSEAEIAESAQGSKSPTTNPSPEVRYKVGFNQVKARWPSQRDLGPRALDWGSPNGVRPTWATSGARRPVSVQRIAAAQTIQCLQISMSEHTTQPAPP